VAFAASRVVLFLLSSPVSRVGGDCPRSGRSLPIDDSRIEDRSYWADALPCVRSSNIRYCDTEMRFTWDPAKARRNQKFHGVSFTTAAQIFDDPNHLVGDNYYMEETGEQRFQI
jgi:Ribonuclease toxin, BrnT, of type II toxin-antitoxin system